MKALEKVLKWIVIGGVFLTPFICLYVANSMFFPFITGKNFAFRIIIEIIFAAWLALCFVSAEYRPRRSWILGALTVFVVIIAIADAQGVNVFKSFWSNFERMDGWVTLVHVLALTVVAASVLREERLWKWLFWVNLAVSVWLSLDGFVHFFSAGGNSLRIDTTFGNPIYMAIYMLFNAFIAALLWIQTWPKPRERAIFSWIYGAVIVIDTVALFLTGTRGTMLGIVGGALLAVLIYAFVGGSRRVRVIAGVCVLIVAIGAGGLYAGRHTPLVKGIGFLDRLASISSTDTTIASRFTNMSIAWQGVKERPILGWGQENYAIVFDKYYDPHMYKDEPWFDRVHDIIFDWWVAGGTLGLLGYLSIFVAAFWILWRSAAFTLGERSVLTGLLAGYFFHNLTVFDNITSYILFASILAYIVYRSTAADDKPPVIAGHEYPALLPYAAIGAAAIAVVLVWYVNVPGINQNLTLLAALEPQPSLTTNLALFKQAESINAMGTQEVREQLVQGTTQVIQKSEVPNDQKQAFFTAAVEGMQAQEAVSPMDARFPLFLGVLYSAAGDYQDAAASLEKAHQLSPGKQAIYYSMAENAAAMGDTSKELEYYKDAFDLLQSDDDARFNYAAALVRAGQYDAADQLIAPEVASGAAANDTMLGAYAEAKQYARAIPLWQALVKAQPNNIQGYFTLAALYYQAGQHEEAISTLRAAETADPSIKDQAEQLIQQIETGSVKVQ